MKTTQATSIEARPARRRCRQAQPESGKPTPRKRLSREAYLVQFRTQQRSFYAQRKRLMEEHPESLYVAICHGKPVVFGQTSIDVAVDFYEKFGDQPVYVGKLADQQDEEVIGGVVAQ